MRPRMTKPPSAMQWMVRHRVCMPRAPRPVPGPIEQAVYDVLTEPLSCPEIAKRMGMLTPGRYMQVRNAIYRLLEKRLIHRHAMGRGPLGGRRVIWARTPQN